MVSNTNPETKAHIKSLLGERYTEDIDMRYEQKTFVKEKDAEKEALKKKTTKIDPTDYLYGYTHQNISRSHVYCSGYMLMWILILT